jgi:Tfp pilus assembly protein PilF
MIGRPSPRLAIGTVLACFVLAGALLPWWDRQAGSYTGILVAICRHVVPWLQPAPLVSGLERSGTIVRLADAFSPGDSLGAVQTSYISFYLPFIVLLLAAARWPLRLVTVAEVLLVLGSVFLVHLGCLSLGVQSVEVDAFVPGGYPALVGPIEHALLRTLHHTYWYTGAQLWAGLVVALILLRAAPPRGDRVDRTQRWASSRALAAACLVVVLPSLMYVAFSPAVRRLSGRDRTARVTAAQAYLRAGNREAAGRLAREAFDATRPDHRDMMLLGLIAEETSPAEAAVWYDKVLAARPGSLGAQLGLARVRTRQGDRDAAMAAYYSVLSIAPGNADAYKALGDLYMARGDYPAARSHYEMAVRFQPDLAASLTSLESASRSAETPADRHDR